MEDIIILGAGGLGQEMAWLIEEINEDQRTWNLLGYLDSDQDLLGKELIGYPVLGGDKEVKRFRNCWFVPGVGDPRLKRKLVERAEENGARKWATLISPTVRVHESNRLGTGVVIGRFTDLTVATILEDHVFLNIHVVLGHGVRVGAFTNIDPNVTINGEAQIGTTCLVGANAFVRDVTVGDFVTIGAGSVVVKSVESNCVVAGVPARTIRDGGPRHTLSKSERRD